jgi:hypothetical protein|tara:strand:- start:8073 stop:8492 length:420 start_codon:yes stop_codon:yes gene_type:complete
MKKLITIFSFLLVAGVGQLQAQCDTVANYCHENNFTVNYVSDGQNYRALLFEEQEAEFETTFFEGVTYRIAACTGFQQGNLIFRVKDELGNTLFDSMDHLNAPYWDFEIESTITVKIVTLLDPLEEPSGCATILIGFKQ